MFKRIIASTMIFGMAAIAPPAHGQVACASRDSLIEGLAKKYGEERVAGGLQSADQMVEVFSSPETGSFTILLTHPNGQSCVVSSGKSWNTFEPTEVPAGSKV